MTKRPQTILTVLMLLLAVPAAADSFHYSCTQMSLDAGLSSPTVMDILEDSNGSLWVGTKEALDVFRASGHKSYRLGGAVCSVVQDPAGRIWAATESSVFRYDSTSDEFETVTSMAGGGLFPFEEEMWIFRENSLWRASLSGDRIDFIQFPQNIFIADIIPYGDCEVIIGSMFNGLWKFDASSGDLTPFSTYEPYRLSCLLRVDDDIYAGSRRDGVFIFSSDGVLKGTVSGLPSDDVTDMDCDGDSIWITTDGGGASILSASDGTLEILRNIPGDSSSLPANALFSVCATPDDTWLGTVRCGAVNVQRHYVKAYGGCAFGLAQDASGTIWVGSEGQGLNSFNPLDGEFRSYPTTKDEYIPVVAPYRDNEVLMMLYHKGMFVMNVSDGRLRPLNIDGQDAVDAQWNSSYLHYCSRVRPDEILIYGPVLYAHNPVDGSTNHFTFADGKPAEWVHISWWGSEFFLASRGNELYINDYSSFVLSPLGCTGSTGDIVCTSFDKALGRIWICSGDEIGYIDYSGKGTPCGEYQRLGNTPFSKASAITVDTRSRLWIAADMQLYLYRPDCSLFSSFGPFDGYALCDILCGWNTEVTGEEFYWAGTAGLVRINTALADAVSGNKKPVLSLNEIISDSNRYVFDGDVPHRITLPWNHGAITLNYKVSNLAFYDKATYTYTISGQDESRITSSMATLDIASLPPGDYTINATCFPSKALEGSNAKALRIKVKQPWYKSLLFGMLMLGILLGLVAYFTYTLVARKLAKGGVVENAISDRDHDFIRRLDTLVEEKMGEEQLDSDYLTTALAISRTSLFEKVKRITGYSLNDYVKRLRINKAAKLLRETSMSIIEISEETGFAYPRYFSSVFKDLTGESPTEFRKSKNNRQ